ncbi:MAG: ChaN family lipoprotein [Gemmataceae bacterium]
MPSPWSFNYRLSLMALGLLLALSCPLSAAADKTKHHSKKTKKLDENNESPKITSAHYRIYLGDGTQSTQDLLLRTLTTAQVVFVGESHDDPVAHYLERFLLEKLHDQAQQQSSDIALSLEMFERDVQGIVDEYLTDLITEKHFLASSRPWKNYNKDYRPLIEYAKEHQLEVIAANAPRRYVNRVGRLGRHSLKLIPNGSRRGLPPLPYGRASTKYRAKFQAIISEMHSPPTKTDHKKDSKKHPHPKPTPSKEKLKEKSLKQPSFDMEKALDAQSLWDATMAYSICERLNRSPHLRIMHVNGSFHTSDRLGICDHLKCYRPNTSFVVVTIIPHEGFPKFDPKKMNGKGDFVIVTDASLPRSYVSKFKK